MCVLAPFLCSCSTLYEYLLECYRGFDNQLSEHLQFRQLEEIAPCAVCQAVLAGKIRLTWYDSRIAEERLEWHFRCREAAQHGPLSQQRPDLPETSVEIQKTTRILLKYDARSNAPSLPPLIDPMWAPRVVDSYNDHVWSKVEAAVQEQALMSSSSLLPDAELASMLFSDTRLLAAHVATQESTAITTSTPSRPDETYHTYFESPSAFSAPTPGRSTTLPTPAPSSIPDTYLPSTTDTSILSQHWRTGTSQPKPGRSSSAHASARKRVRSSLKKRTKSIPPYRPGVEAESAILSKHFALMCPDRVKDVYPLEEMWEEMSGVVQGQGSRKGARQEDRVVDRIEISD